MRYPLRSLLTDSFDGYSYLSILSPGTHRLCGGERKNVGYSCDLALSAYVRKELGTCVSRHFPPDVNEPFGWKMSMNLPSGSLPVRKSKRG